VGGGTVPGQVVARRGELPDEDIVAFEVAVNDAVGVKVDEGATDLHSHLLHDKGAEPVQMSPVLFKDLFEIAHGRQF